MPFDFAYLRRNLLLFINFNNLRLMFCNFRLLFYIWKPDISKPTKNLPQIYYYLPSPVSKVQFMYFSLRRTYPRQGHHIMAKIFRICCSTTSFLYFLHRPTLFSLNRDKFWQNINHNVNYL